MSSSVKLIRSMTKKVSRVGTEDGEDLEGSVHTPEDDKAVQALQELLLQQSQLSPKFMDYHTLIRFLRKSEYDILKAKESFLNYLKWREEFGVDTIAKEFQFEEYEEVQKYYPHGFHGVDRYGRPVYIERLGMLDLDGLLRVTTIERLVNHHVYEQEKTTRLRFHACTTAARKRIASITAIMDVKGVGSSNFSKAARYLFQELSKIDMNYYPETLNLLYIVNAGPGFRLLWQLLKTFLDKRTKLKIQVLGTDFRSKLLEVIDPSNLPTFLGGECTCSAYGGCLLSDKGPWKDPAILQLPQNEDNAVTVEEAWMSAQSTPDNKDGHRRQEVELTFLTQKVNMLEAAAEEAGKKIRLVEAALEDAKLELQIFSQQIQELRTNLEQFVTSCAS